MDHIGNRRALLVTLMTGGMCLATSALAQASDDQIASGNDIIVTAQRRAERLEDVPVAITAVSGASLERSGVRQLYSIGQVAAGVQVNRGGSFTQPAVRGVSTLTLGFGFENNVAVYVDGFYQPDAISINVDLVNLGSIQVLKGPQGTLYGRNATGGAIVIDTLAPSDVFTANGEIGYARFDDKRAKAYVSGPIAEGVAFSLAGSIRNSDSYIRDIGADPNSSADDFNSTPIRNRSLRAKLEFKPTSDLTATLGFNFVQSGDSRGAAYTYIAHHVYAGVTPKPANRPGLTSLNGRPDTSARMYEATGKIIWNTAIGTLSSYTSYGRRHSNSVFDIDGTKLNPSYSDSRGIYQDTFQQSFDYAINAIDRLDLVVGLSYYNDRLNTRDAKRYQGAQPPGPPDGIQNIRLSSDALAAYVDATLQVTDKLFLTGGVRYSDERRTFQYREDPGFPGAITFLPRPRVTANFASATPRAVLRYELGDRTNVYASYTQGFRSGVYNPAVVANPVEAAIPARPEKITAYEIGFKTASSTLRFDTAAYYYDYKDLQVAVTATGPTRQILFNAPKAEIYGAEGQLSYTPTEDLQFRAGVAYVHARYRDFYDSAGNPVAFGTGLNAATGFNTTQRQDWSNTQMARAPTWTGNAGIDYTTDFAGGRLNGTINASYTSSYVVTNASLYGPLDPTRARKQRYRQGAYGVVNLGVNWTDGSGHYTVGVYADNLTDTKYALTYSGSGLGDYKQYADPLVYGVRLGFKY